eukprot:4287918-Prymnesium_polylepis.1
MRTSNVSTTLTLGRDARSRPTHSPTARAGGTQPITKISRSKLGHAAQGRMRVCHAWQHALSAQWSAQMRTSDVSTTTLTLGRDARSCPNPLRSQCTVCTRIML